MARKVSFARGTAAQKRRSRVAEEIAAEHPGMPMGMKMAIATNVVKGKKMKRGKRAGRFGREV